MLRPTVRAASRHVVVVGAGGNIGSHLVPHLARMPELGRLTLIDQDSYEPSNLRTQAIEPSALRRMKAKVQARVAHRINPRLAVTAIAEPVEQVPLGLLRCDLILGCLDSRRSRQHLNEAALRLGVPWLDAGVQADGLLARLDCFAPNADAPCLECGWSDADYAALEQRYPCAAGPAAHPTGAPSGLGALAAALQAIECQKHLAGDPSLGPLQPGEQLVIGASQYLHYRTAYRRNPECRLGEHDAWTINATAVDFAATTLADLGQGGTATLSVLGKMFATELVCSGCAATRPTLQLATSLQGEDLGCARCGAAMVIAGFGLADRLRPGALPRKALDATLSRVGLRPGEVLSIETAGEQIHLELQGA